MSIAAAHITFGEMHPRFEENISLLKIPAERGGKKVNILLQSALHKYN